MSGFFIGIGMHYLRMDGKRGHVTCGNRLAIECQESFQTFASLEEELLLCSGLLGPYMKMFLKSTRDASYILAKEVGWHGYE